jgi:hypothetical protein
MCHKIDMIENFKKKFLMFTVEKRDATATQPRRSHRGRAVLQCSAAQSGQRRPPLPLPFQASNTKALFSKKTWFLPL